jgi:protocatechuate 3,4-dioxygenase beta subunit
MPLQRLSLSFATALAAYLLLAPIIASAQTAAGNPKPAGTISGEITLNGKGVADILVAATLGDRPVPQPAARAKSDASGRYRLTGLPAGQYLIMAIAPALVATEQTGFVGSVYGTGKAVMLESGEDVADVNIKLLPGSVITGRVTDADGRPVVEERINLEMVNKDGQRTPQTPFSMWIYQMSQTDDRGVYRIYGLPAGRYRVSAGSKEGTNFVMSRHRAIYRVAYYGDTSDEAKATIVELQAGSEATDIDIRLGRAASTFVASGRLVDAETGQPIPGLRLAYGPGQPNQPFHAGYVGLATNARGEFWLEGLEPGRYGVTVAGVFESGAHYSDPLFFDVADADVTNLELKAMRGQTLSGVVVFEGSRARELQQQIGTLRVGASVVMPNQRNPTSSSASIAPDGSFQINGVRPGKARLYVAAAYNSPLRGITIVRAERGGVDVTQSLEVPAGESITDLRIVASLGAGAIRGTVRYVGGELPPNVNVFVHARKQGSNAGNGALVDARGRFLVGSLTGGNYDVMLTLSYSGPTSGIPKPQTRTVTVSDGTETQVDFIVDLTPKEGGP